MSHTRKATERGSDVCRLGPFMGPKWGPRASSFYTLRRGLPTRSPAKASRLAHPSRPSGRRVSDTLALLLPWSGGGRHHRGPPRGLPLIWSLYCSSRAVSLLRLWSSLFTSYLPKHVHSYERLRINTYFARNHTQFSSLLSMISCSTFSYTVHFDI